MGFMDELKKIIHPYDDEDYDYEDELDDYAEEPQETAPRAGGRRPSPFASTDSSDYTAPAAPAAAPSVDADAVADEISKNLENLVGTTEDVAPKAEPKHPVHDTTTSKFANLQFGRNYDLNGK
mgnify:CR=1 FL=1